MRFHKFVLTGLTALAGLGMASQAMADGRAPGSLLLYPEFDNRAGVVTVVTVTNTATDVGDVDVEFVYIGRYDQFGDVECEEWNRTVTLTDNDTLTLITNVHNPQHEQGFLYVFAQGAGVGLAMAHDYLIGNVMTVDGIQSFEYSVNPVAYLAGPDVENSGNHVRDLDGNEYEESPGELLIPRFLGQGNIYNSELILVGMTGSKFDVTVDFLIYNDNEEEFSSEYTFYCWERVHLLDISGIFSNDFLQNFTDDDPDEILGAPHVEAGWFRFWGSSASSSVTTIPDPAVYGVLVERIGTRGVADLPFETGTNAKGKLLPRDLMGQD
jgi:hypothetical protein